MTNIQAPSSTWSSVVEQIAAGSQSAVGELYRSLQTIRLFLRRQTGLDPAEDAYHDLILDLVGAIKKGNLREPEALPAYAMTIARGKVCSHIREAIRDRRTVGADSVILTCAVSETPEQVLRSEREAVAKRVLTGLPPRHRETLIRFYLNGESEEEIRVAMGMSCNQFRIIKGRAKLRYTELVQQEMTKPVPSRKPVQTAALLLDSQRIA